MLGKLIQNHVIILDYGDSEGLVKASQLLVEYFQNAKGIQSNLKIVSHS